MEADDVGVLQALQHLHLLAETLPLRLGQLTGLQRMKTYGGYGGNLHAKEFILLFYPDVNVKHSAASRFYSNY